MFRREETPPRRRRERRGSSTHHHNSHHSHGGDANAQINQIIRKLERDDRRERTRLAVQVSLNIMNVLIDIVPFLDKLFR